MAVTTPTTSTDEVPVWDPLVRIFHWALVVAFLSAYVTEGDVFERLQDRFDGESLQLLHAWSGYVVVGLLLIRLIWGFVGPRHARFADFVFRPTIVLRYLREVLTLRARRFLGHNPAGGAMIVLLLLALTASALSGVALYGADKGLGPLAGVLTASSDQVIEVLEETHEAATNLTLLLIGAHLLGIIWESALHRENLVRAMLTGRKRRER